MSDSTARPSITAAEALALDPLGDDVVFLDIHLRTAADNCEAIFRSGHVPDAKFVDVERHLLDPEGALPSSDALQQLVWEWGIGPRTHVIVYGGTRYAPTARAWWTLRWAGVERVSVLEGGLLAWAQLGGSIELGQPEVSTGGVVLWPGALPTVDSRGVHRVATEGVVLDARTAVEFRDDADRLPGTVNAPAALNVDESGGALLPPAELAAYYRRLGVTPATRVAVTSGRGISAALTVLALDTIGVRAALAV